MSTYDMGKAELRNACKTAGIKYSNMTNETMRKALQKHIEANMAKAAPVEATAPEAVVTPPPAVESAPAAEPAAPLCAVCDHIEELHKLSSSTHPFTPKPAAPAPAEKPKAEATPKDARNGVTMPRSASLCLMVWQTLDKLRAEGKATPANALVLLKDAGMAEATVRTQYARWRKFHGLVGAAPKPPRKPKQANEAAK